MNFPSLTVGTAGLLAALSLCGCSGSDTSIARDYVIFDGDGSNQTLVGANGMVAIGDVTAYKLEEPYIYVEVGGRPRLDDRSTRSCNLARVDMRNANVFSPPAGSAEARKFASKIADGGQRVLSWNCAFPPDEYHGLLYGWIGK